MKLSTANLSQKLQSIKPIKKLSGKLKRTAGASSAKPRSRQPVAAEQTAAERVLVSTSTNTSTTSNSITPKESASTVKPDSTKRSAPTSSSAPHKSTEANIQAVPSFIQNSKLVQNSKGARVAFHLLLVKPWVLVVGLWLVSALSAVMAIEGLISPRKLTRDWPEPAVEVAPVIKSNSFIDVEQGAEGIASDENAPEASDSKANETASASGLPVWPLVTLVGSCAAGCVVISRRRAMLRMAVARARSRGRKRPVVKAQNAPVRLKAANRKTARRTGSSPDKQSSIAAFQATARAASSVGDKSKSATSAPRERKRRQRKRPSVQPAASKPSKNRVLVSRSNAQQAAPQSRVSQPKKPQRTRQKVARLVRRQPVVSVVPANHSNRLDWADGSLAHDMDRRFSMREASSQRERAAM